MKYEVYIWNSISVNGRKKRVVDTYLTTCNTLEDAGYYIEDHKINNKQRFIIKPRFDFNDKA